MEKTRTGISIWHFILVLLLAVIIALVVRVFFVEPTLVRGASMAPTLHDDDRLLISKMSEPERFDVIVFRTEEGNSLVKRVIGLPGERIEYKGDNLYIDGERYEETYLEINKKALTDGGPLTNTFQLEDTGLESETVPEGHLFVMGDNRRISMDSRKIGAIPVENVIGVSKLIFFPFHDFQWMNEEYSAQSVL